MRERSLTAAAAIEKQSVFPDAVGDPLHFLFVVAVERVGNQLVGEQVVVDVARHGGGVPLVAATELPGVMHAPELGVEIDPVGFPKGGLVGAAGHQQDGANKGGEDETVHLTMNYEL